MRFLLGFALGTVAGMYAAQNYDVPNVKTYGKDLADRLRSLEKEHRKPGEK